ncbi:aggregation-promoting factor C-terminal-like domain-containing protein [Actinocorallia populi]|uniref:aggregation-promoting factor C-terminal-like domain-containing protein n=1 Tax=Actinocorallia populi TaxID=2079200 RepID=UPI0018E55F81|nr:transglycosylase SLT domain-containing protein [Actinocorallia populi]
MTGLAIGLGTASTGTTAHAATGTTNASSATAALRVSQPASRKATKRKLTVKQRNKAHGRAMVKKRGWSDRQYRCLSRLWTKESNWNHRAYNPSSGAGGIPQALPASKMGSAGSDWRTNPKTQIKWGLRYIKGRYGTPCGAWAHFQSRNWY